MGVGTLVLLADALGVADGVTGGVAIRDPCCAAADAVAAAIASICSSSMFSAPIFMMEAMFGSSRYTRSD